MARILVVDDSMFMRLTLKNMLEKNGLHQVIGEADNDHTAVAKFLELKPDLVTMDVIMPVDSGIWAVGKIMQINPQAKIIVISAMGQEKIVQEALEAGAKGFVTKPVKSEELLETINKVLG